MERSGESVTVDISIRMDDGTTIFSEVSIYSDLCWVEDVLESALQAVRQAMGTAE